MVKLHLNPRWQARLPQHLQSFGKEMDQLLDAFLGDGGAPGSWHAPSALWEEGGKYFLELELPGVAQDSLNVTVEKGVLKISAERKEPEGERRYFQQSRSFGKFDRAFALPEVVDSESVAAELKDGVLSIVFSKRPEAQAKTIPVKIN